MEPYLDESRGLLRLRTSQEHPRTKSAFFFFSELFFCPVFQVHTLGFIVHQLKRGRIVSWSRERAGAAYLDELRYQPPLTLTLGLSTLLALLGFIWMFSSQCSARAAQAAVFRCEEQNFSAHSAHGAQLYLDVSR